ncbi:hypothetical protein H5410_057874 [Solanum commersonii]|uniref:Uncharacterized protein n=1 Tax=Solanum commersonii TaxID=4109 RepID=A0A9J5WRH1_SOLCO|nr:hypothetical protein H5410_057874 [Solanum commersonii]
MRSETSEDMLEAQPYEEDAPVDALKKAKDFLAKLKDKILRNYVKILVYFDSYIVGLPLRILICLIYDWADHRQVSDPVSLILTCLIYDWADHRQVSDPVSLMTMTGQTTARYILSFMDQEDIKSTRLDEVDIPQNLDLLNKWTIPKVNIKTVYDYGWFDKISNKQLIKTIEQSLALNYSEQTIRLLNKRDIEFYKSQYKFLHIGMVQIAFKPLTLNSLHKFMPSCVHAPISFP